MLAKGRIASHHLLDFARLEGLLTIKLSLRGEDLGQGDAKLASVWCSWRRFAGRKPRGGERGDGTFTGVIDNIEVSSATGA